MKKSSVTLTLLMAFIFSFFTVGSFVNADEKTPTDEFRVGMEAGYAPFNWSQQTDANNAVPIQGQKSYAGGYDVQIAKKVADGLGKKLVIMQTKWDGLAPALQSGKIDAIIAGMSPTAERKKEIDFTDPYYESQLVVVVKKDSKYANAKSLADLSNAKITAQLNTFHYNVIDQIPDVQKQQAMDNFSAMRTALASGMIDGYVSERPEGVTATSVNKDLKMLEFTGQNGFKQILKMSKSLLECVKVTQISKKLTKFLAVSLKKNVQKLWIKQSKINPLQQIQREKKLVCSLISKRFGINMGICSFVVQDLRYLLH